MTNQPVNIDGKEYWISRSVAVCGAVFTIDDGLRVLAVKRGNNLDEPGKWCLPCGYLDWNETLEEACAREIMEETGLHTHSFNLYHIDSNPESNRQNVTVVYWSFSRDYASHTVSVDGVESVDLKWIAIPDIKYYDWAFGHKNLIQDILMATNLYKYVRP